MKAYPGKGRRACCVLSRDFRTGKSISCELLSVAGNFQRRPTARERLYGLDDVSDARGANNYSTQARSQDLTSGVRALLLIRMFFLDLASQIHKQVVQKTTNLGKARKTITFEYIKSRLVGSQYHGYFNF